MDAGNILTESRIMGKDRLLSKVKTIIFLNSTQMGRCARWEGGMNFSLVKRKIPLENEKVCYVTGRNPLANNTIKSHGKFSDRLTVCFSVKL